LTFRRNVLALLHCTLDHSQSKGSEERQIGQRDKFSFCFR